VLQLHCWVVVVALLMLLLHYLHEVKWWLLLKLCEVFLMLNCCCFSLINSLYKLLLIIIIECEISPLLFECCLYVGNVQITRSNRWCELIPSVVIGVMLWYVTGWRYLYVLFSLLRITFLSCCCWITFGFKTLICGWCWGLSAEFWLKRWTFSAAILFELLKAVV